MKNLLVIIVTLLVFQSCRTKTEQPKELSRCDELNIVYFQKDTFVFKTNDTGTIKNFTQLIFKYNENFTDTCEITEQLIYKSQGKQIFTAQVSRCNKSEYVTYW
jgi:hypothetical protein